MKNKTSNQRAGSAGRMNDRVRSDCRVTVTLTQSGGIALDLTSKVASLYGASIRSQIAALLGQLGAANAVISVEDRGAVPFVIAARVEAALKRADPECCTACPTSGAIAYPMKNSRDRLRRTRLYLPGNEPQYFLNAALHKPDCIILDLEDSVAPAEKDAARILVRHALAGVSFGDAERMVRINPLPAGLDDLEQIVPGNVETILIPKCESAAHVNAVDAAIDALCAARGVERTILLLPIIESALGVVRAFEIAGASRWTCALAIGLEDYTADLGVARTRGGAESLFARSAVINAAKAAGIQALDSVFSDIDDDDALRESVMEAKAIGFEGKGCIHPRQIRTIHHAFAPTETEIDYARRVIDAFTEAQRTGSGVVAIGSKMIDAPVVKRAQRILALAEAQARA